MRSDGQRLPRNLERAFDRLARARSEETAPELPHWPRNVRIGIDYSVHATVPDARSSDAECDAFAWTCMVLGNAAKADKARGDPPASCAARDAAERAGPDYSAAFALLNSIRDCSDAWGARGWATPALPPASMVILQRAARAERVKAADDLPDVLAAAQDLANQLAYPLLSTPG